MANDELVLKIRVDGAPQAAAGVEQVKGAIACTEVATDELSESVQKLLAKYDPLGAKLRALEADFRALDKAAAGGKIGSRYDAAVDSAYKSLQEQIAKTKALMVTAGVAGAEGFENVAKAAEKSMFATVGARRELMVLAHEAVSGNFSRIPGSFMVLAERMQLTGGALAALINPFTMTAAAAAALGVAYLQGSAEAHEFARALVLSGNAAGSSVSQLQALAGQVANSTGATKGLAAEVLSQAAATGKVSSDMLQQVAQAAIQLERVGGKAASETVQEFAELGGAPVEAVKKLDEKYHFLTASVLEQIQVLHDQGQETDAARLAQTTYFDALSSRIPALAENLGILERAWHGIRDAAKGAWDRMLEVGRNGWNPLANLDAGFAKTMPGMASIVDRMKIPEPGEAGSRQARIDAEIAATEKQRLENLKNQAGKAFLALREQNRSQRERHDQEVIRARELGTQSGASAAEIQDQVRRIDERYKTSKGAARDPLDTQLENYRRDANAAAAGLAPATVKEIENLGVLLQRGKVDAAEYNKLLDTVLNKDSVLRSEQERIDKSKLAQSAMGQAVENLQAQYDRQNAIYGEKQMTAAERELESALRKVQEAASKERERLAQLAATLQGDDVDALAAFSQALQRVAEQEEQQMERVVALQAEQQRLNSLWETGAGRALDKYLASAKSVADQVEEAFTRGFQGMEDALSSFATTGKISFSSLANSLISDLLRIQLRASMAPVTQGLSGWLSGLWGGSGTSGGTIAGVMVNGVAGGPLSGTGLHAGGIAGAEATFLRAVPAGVFAEAPRLHGGGIAADEVPAILRKGEGVFTPEQMRALGSPQISVTINNQAAADGYQASATPRQNGAGFDLEVLVAKVVQSDQRRNGPMTQGFASLFGLARAV